MNTVNFGTLKNVATYVLGLYAFNKEELMREIESQDMLTVNPDFDSVEEFADLIIEHQDDEPTWEYEWEQDCFDDDIYSICCNIAGKNIQLYVWDDDVASDVDEKFDREQEPDFDSSGWDEEFMRLLSLKLKK